MVTGGPATHAPHREGSATTGGDGSASLALLAGILAPERPPNAHPDPEPCAGDLALRLETADWPALLALAGGHGLVPALHPCLLAAGLHELPPRPVRAFLAIAHRRNQLRNERISAQLDEITATLNTHGIRPVLLKGAAHLRLGLYSDPAMRMLSDLDLLVPEARLPDAVAALHGLGYRERHTVHDTRRGRGGHHHHPALVRDDAPAPVELHRKVVVSHWSPILPAEEVRAAAMPLGAGGTLAPAPLHLALHNIVHAQLVSGDYLAAELRLRDLLDLVLIARRWPVGIDWAEVARRLRTRHGHGGMVFYMTLGTELLGGPPPAGPGTLGSGFARWRWERHREGRLRALRRLARALAYSWGVTVRMPDDPSTPRRFIHDLLTPVGRRERLERLRARLRVGP